MIRRLAVLSRLAATTAVQQYGLVVLSMAVALGLSLLLRRYVYPRPLFLLALVLSSWGRGLSPGLVGAGVAIIAVRVFFPEWLPEYGLLSDTAVFSLAAVALSALSSTKLRAEQQRKLAEEQLRLSERRLRLALSAAHLGAWAVDLRTNVIAISGEYSKMYGLAHDRPSLTYQEWLGLIHPDDRGRVRALLRETVEQTHIWDAEFRVVWPDGSIHWLLGKGTVLPDHTGRPIRMAGVNLDITERKQAEELRSHLAAIVESSDDAIIGKTVDGTIVSWNSGAERLYGYKAEEMVGRPISLLAPSDHLYEIPQILEELRHGERIVRYETEGIRKDGRRIDVSLTISPIKDRAGTIIGASRIARDITERKRAEASLRESEERFRHTADTAPVMIWISGRDKLWTNFAPSSTSPGWTLPAVPWNRNWATGGPKAYIPKTWITASPPTLRHLMLVAASRWSTAFGAPMGNIVGCLTTGYRFTVKVGSQDISALVLT